MNKFISLLLLVSTCVVGLNNVHAQELMQSAKQEGMVTIYTAGPKNLSDSIINGFKNKYHLNTQVYNGTTGAILSKLDAEKNNPMADVVVLASSSAAVYLKKQGMLLQYKEAINGDKIRKEFKDSEGYFYGYSASAVGIAYNPNVIKNPPQTWADLTKAEYKGTVVIPDPRSSGSCLDFIGGYINKNHESGWALFDQLKKNGASVVGANKEALDAVITGARGIVFAGVDYMALNAKAKGEPIVFVYPKEGTIVNPRPAMILKTSKNINNAKLFINYLLSDEVQQIVLKNNLVSGDQSIMMEGKIALSKISVIESDWNEIAKTAALNAERFAEIWGL